MHCRFPNCPAGMLLWYPSNLRPWGTSGFQAEGCTSHFAQGLGSKQREKYETNSGCSHHRGNRIEICSPPKKNPRSSTQLYTVLMPVLVMEVGNGKYSTWICFYLSWKILFNVFFFFFKYKRRINLLDRVLLEVT